MLTEWTGDPRSDEEGTSSNLIGEQDFISGVTVKICVDAIGEESLCTAAENESQDDRRNGFSELEFSLRCMNTEPLDCSS
jgi:hypothetical protein